jgi:methylenetetrahydrofolate dehydrogenase (NADP+)/methenyltetrahydrofolate cyclohydrolase
MSAQVMDGTTIAAEIGRDTARRAQQFLEAHGRRPVLATLLVGDDPASRTYVRMKAARSAAQGVESQQHELPATASTEQVVRVIGTLSRDLRVDGILVQHPVPRQVDERAVFDAIDPAKDVDGVTAASFSAMAFGEAGFASCTPAAILRLLRAYDIEVAGKRAVVVGRSPILGKPAAMLLLAADATVTVCHSRTRDLAEVVREADLVVAAVGRPALVRGDWIKPGAVVVDAGYNAGNLGDVDYAGARERAAAITPVPGGVGPVTIAVLLSQTVDAAERHVGLRVATA